MYVSTQILSYLNFLYSKNSQSMNLLLLRKLLHLCCSFQMWDSGVKISSRFTKAVAPMCSIRQATPVTLLKKRLWYGCFLLNFAKFSRTLLLQITSSGCFQIYRSYEIITVNFLCIRHKNRQKPNQHSELLLLKINLNFDTSD